MSKKFWNNPLWRRCLNMGKNAWKLGRRRELLVAITFLNVCNNYSWGRRKREALAVMRRRGLRSWKSYSSRICPLRRVFNQVHLMPVTRGVTLAIFRFWVTLFLLNRKRLAVLVLKSKQQNAFEVKILEIRSEQNPTATTKERGTPLVDVLWSLR